jgi:hypothetical protein
MLIPAIVFSMRAVHRQGNKQNWYDDEAEVRVEYVSPEIDPDFPYSRHHVQFHQNYHEVRERCSLQKLHIPTGGVTISR